MPSNTGSDRKYVFDENGLIRMIANELPLDVDVVREAGNLRRCLEVYATCETAEITDERKRDESRRSTYARAVSRTLNAIHGNWNLDVRFVVRMELVPGGNPAGKPYADLVSYLKGFSQVK